LGWHPRLSLNCNNSQLDHTAKRFNHAYMKTFSVAGVCLLVSVACLSPRGAHAGQFVLDTGTPASSTFPIVSNADWYAAEFYATAGETITDLSAYLTSMTGNGDNFAFDVYTDGSGGFLSARNSALSGFLAFSAIGTFSAAGWNTTSVDWVVPASGDYWLAIEGDTAGTHNLPTFDAQKETSVSTGSAPALAFAGDTGTGFKTSNGAPIGLEVTAATVPEPAGWWFLAGGGILAFCLRGGRRRLGRGIVTG